MNAINPFRLNHAVIYVTDLEESIDFYSDVFGMTVIAREPRVRAAFLRLGADTNHHDLGMFEAPQRRENYPAAPGLYHLAWQVATIDDLVNAKESLLDAEAYTGESSHGATLSLYGMDPSGNEFEIMWMLPRSEWGQYENSAPVDRLNLLEEYERWKGIKTS